MRRGLVAIVLACGVVAPALGACSASSSDATFGPPASIVADSGVDGQDESPDAKSGTPSAPSLVLVNGLIDGGKAALDNVRVCIEGKQYPLPDAVPMPMSSYPGISRGTGVDLGFASTIVSLRVFRAADLMTDAAWATTRTTCDSWQYGPKSTLLSVNLLPGPNLAVLVDDLQGTDGIGVRTAQLPPQYAGQKDTLQVVAAEFSTFGKSGETLHVSVEGVEVGSGASGMLLSPSPYGFPTLGAPLDSAKIRFERRGADGATAVFDQTLGSVQFLADPTTTTASYFGRRTNYAFVLLGDAAKAVTTDAKDLQFNGKGLHVAAVPYSAVNP